MHHTQASTLSSLGVGVVYWEELDPLLEETGGLVDVIEVEPQAFWHETSRSDLSYAIQSRVLERLRSLPQPKIVHSVGLPVGGTHSSEPAKLQLLQQNIQELNAVWASEHLSFNQAEADGQCFQTGFLLPPLQTRAGVETAIASIRQWTRGLSIPFAFETGVNYLRPRAGELSDGAFVAAIAEQVDCAILLDLHNIWTNERNGRQSMQDFLAEIPLERVWEVHLAGGFEFNDYWLDAHSGGIPDPVFAWAQQLIPLLPNLRALIFEVLPTFIPHFGLDGVRSQLEKMHQLWDLRVLPLQHFLPEKASELVPLQKKVSPLLSPAWKGKVENLHLIAPSSESAAIPVANDEDGEVVTPRAWENALGAIAINRISSDNLFMQLSCDPGSQVLQALVQSFRAGMVVDGLKLTARLVMLHCGEARFRELLRGFWQQAPPQLFSSAEASAFADYLTHQRQIPYLADVLRFEKAVLHLAKTGESTHLRFSVDPVLLLQALEQGELPQALPQGNYSLDVM